MSVVTRPARSARSVESIDVPLGERTNEIATADRRIDTDALIREARRRQRRRRLLVLGLALLVTGGGFAVWLLAFGSQPSTVDSQGRSAGVAHSPTLILRVVGTPTPVQGYNPGGACPDGQFSWSIRSSVGQTIGTDLECDLAESKVDKPNWGVWSTHAVVNATYTIPGGTIVTHERQTFRFSKQTLNSRAPIRRRALIVGRIVGGSGRYAHVHGSISGSGIGINNDDNSTISFHFH